jgi:hypothetical protein
MRPSVCLREIMQVPFLAIRTPDRRGIGFLAMVLGLQIHRLYRQLNLCISVPEANYNSALHQDRENLFHNQRGRTLLRQIRPFPICPFPLSLSPKHGRR